ncbi:cleavage and polyadenylation specificity factor subunit 1 isoform X11 [Diabrotica virgifera virgifera]|uniref:Cleavage and polyadenylation specificity factor subunit 1 n=1 Tax=Diabrotica virgifera virgifera TaxID=50390 RepID=A0ABM5KN20_DIAVI|nr:cleavage and polyadenylation specificity factor subunit 1 isoform X2 [Diabrotica virgifera virgifera]XP_050511555.1 cleavage and polyadenylation specificity factor subunit 1 isoform X3 [Diabrotica virgifera virgifera]XP_050511560.1 cleavage and polyadenylation specificity factor subunit 1 isoform X4 [Diabrotica virgifera virgifera]XP_050511564.1 cleavage and polyadenylation specificity factor subunit 1 isoform X5 [Diabrotica virgifera virgifera]XP_050511568.1 cleavage and polyadenylation spe
MFSICRQNHPATAVEHAISCYFFNKVEKCLVTAGANVLKIYRLVPDVDSRLRSERYSEFYPPKSKLECVAQYTLFGNIMSIQSVSLTSCQRDALLLGFSDAKLSVVEYDPENHDLRTLSLHYFEEEDMKDGWTHHHHVPLIRVDPENRCAVMTVFGRKLVVLPFRRDTSIDDNDGDIKPMASNTSTTKAPILASYMILLKDFLEKIDNIIDIQFLHGYYEPTLLILYEPLKTFSGRVAVRSDTCAMSAISLNLQQKVHPVIWSVANLPFDCVKAVPIKKPIGGTLIMAINSLIYLNQSIPPYGVSLNSIADSSTNFPLKPQEDIKITLDCAQIGFLEEDTLVLSLKGGELYVLTLLADSMRYIRSFHFEKAAASVLTTCICICENNFLFLGSRLGNSLLLRFTEKANEVITLDDNDEPSNKRSRTDKSDRTLDSLTDCMASDVLDIRDPEELEVYGTQKQAGIQISSYIFEVCDSFLNIGPCGNMSIGEPAFLSEEFNDNVDLNLELVTTAGYGKNGALCVLQKNIRPQIVTTFTLPGCSNMWTVKSGDDQHAFLILSQEDGTMILQTGQEINEIDNTGFATHGPTVYAGNLGNNKYIVQVTTVAVRLLQGANQLQHVPMDLGSPIVHISSADPYISLMTSDGQVITLMLRETRGTAKLVVSKSTLSNNPPVSTICMYKDTSGLFTNKIPEEFVQVPAHVIREYESKSEIENEDDLLYGEGDFKMPSLSAAPPKPKVYYNWWKKYMTPNRPTFWLFVVRDNSNLEIYSIPDFKLCFFVANLCFGYKVLVDSLESVNALTTPSPNDNQFQDLYQVKELLMVGLGNNGSRPVLLVRLQKDLYIYEVFRFPRGNLKLRFKKMKHNILYSPNVDTGVETENSDYFALQEKIMRLRYFDNIAGYNGVFICGANPHWLFLTSRGELRTHPMVIDGEIFSFAQFNNINCPQGFLYFNKKSELRIGVLPTHLTYDAPWPVRKVPLRCTPHFVTYHLESKTYCLVTSIAEPSNQYYKFNGEDKELSIEEKGDRFPYPCQEIFSLCLFSPVSWDIIPNTKLDLEEWEHVNCLKNVALAYEGTRSGLKGYIAVGTNYNYGEDITSRGRILIYDIIEVVPEPGQPLTKNKFKEIYAKDQKGPVTALSQVKGFLVSAVGQKIYIWQLKDNDLIGVAFIDTQVYTHQILTIKSLLLVGDVYKSIALLRFQEEYRTLSMVSRDFKPNEVYSIEYMIDNSSLGFLVSDGEQNLAMYMYQPESRESLGGQRLLRKADFHLGQTVNTFFKIKCKLGELGDDKKHFSGADRRFITMFATLDGGIGYIMPVPEKTYRRLLMLQNVLVSQGAHIAGLNPKAFRLCCQTPPKPLDRFS